MYHIVSYLSFFVSNGFKISSLSSPWFVGTLVRGKVAFHKIVRGFQLSFLGRTFELNQLVITFEGF